MLLNLYKIISAGKKYLIVIAGPTAVGKTGLSIELATHFNTVILSADSRQFYRELSIGTAKPSPEQLQSVEHFFVNNKSVSELYGAGHYEKDAITLLDELFKKHDLVFLVGGSGLYIDAVLNGVDEFESVPVHIREELNEKFEKNGLGWLQHEVKEKDPQFYKTADINNPQRLIRALEVLIHSGQTYSSQLNKKKVNRNFVPVKILINLERDKLYRQIESRVDKMIRDGLVEEAEQFRDRQNLNALKTVGYKEIFDYLAAKTTLAEAIQKIKQHTRNYAKRQLTWFRNKDQFIEFGPSEKQKIIQYIDDLRSKNE